MQLQTQMQMPEKTSTARIKIEDFNLGKKLGSGKQGEVYAAMHKATGFLCAIKKI